MNTHAGDATINNYIRFASKRNSGTQLLNSMGDFSIRLAGLESIYPGKVWLVAILGKSVALFGIYWPSRGEGRLEGLQPSLLL